MGGEPPRQLGRYVLFERLASGGMAELHLATMSGAEDFQRVVVVKRILPHRARDPVFLRMLLNEAKLSAQLHHPNIVQVLDLCHVDEEHFIVMEYIHGVDLHTVLRESVARRSIPLSAALSAVLGVAAGLHHAHETRDSNGEPLCIVHRDVSPSNVLVAQDGAVKVVDFGIAKALAHTEVTTAGTVKGKVGYMAPEQCRGDRVDRRVDVYALGVLLYEVTLGRRLFVGDNQFAIMNSVLLGRFPRPSDIDPQYPAALEEVILRALRPDPDERYATAAEFSEALTRAATQCGVSPSATDLSEHVLELFGDRPVPIPPAHETVEATVAPAVEGIRSARASRRWGTVLTLGIGVGVGIGALQLIGASSTDARGESRVQQVLPPREEPPAEAEEVVLRPDPTPAQLPLPSEIPDVGGGAVGVPAPTPSSEPKLGSRRGKRRSRSKKKARRKRTPTAKRKTVDDALPPGLNP